MTENLIMRADEARKLSNKNRSALLIKRTDELYSVIRHHINDATRSGLLQIEKSISKTYGVDVQVMNHLAVQLRSLGYKVDCQIQAPENEDYWIYRISWGFPVE